MELTILTPTFNRCTNLKLLFKSLLKQTNYNFEWLIIDDGSNDGTKKWVKNDVLNRILPFKVQYRYKENGGKHTALNFSHEYINGNYLVIVDSDDQLIPEAVNCILNLWREYGGDNKIGGITFQRVYKNGRILDQGAKKRSVTISTFANEVNRGMQGDHCETIRSELFKRFSFPIFTGEIFVGEAAMWYLATKDYKIVYSPKAIYVCEYLEGGLTKSGRKFRIKNPHGSLWHAEIMMNKDFKLRIRFKNALLYSCYARFIGSDFKSDGRELSHVLLFITWIPGYFLFKYWDSKYNL
jgi:glycosyltransferase involved in cell wall biosynthesis